jgi:Flp pilus assembly protein TadD
VQHRALALAGFVVGGLFATRSVIRNRDWNNDIVLYTRTIDLEPEAYPILNDLGAAYAKQGALDKAESVWGGLLARSPNNSEALNNMGTVAARKKQYSEAIDYFRRAIKARPTYAEPHLNLAKAYRLMGLTGPAELEVRTALALSPLDPNVSNELGRLLLEEGRISEAEDQFRVSIRSWPNALAYDFLGEINIRRRAVGEAERDFRAALSLDESDSNAHFGLGFLFKAAGRKAEALSQYQAGLMKDPTNPQALAAVQKLRQEGARTAP